MATTTSPEKGNRITYADDDIPASRRVIRYADDEENNDPAMDARRLQRRISTASQLSTASGQSGNNSNAIERARRGSIDPRLGIPIEYRTLSIHVEQTRERAEREQARLGDGFEKKEEAAAKPAPPPTVKPQKKAADELAGMDHHTASVDELTQRFSTNIASGLTKEQVATNLSKYGPNKPSPPPSHLARKIFGYFFGGFGALLLVGGILVFISWKPLGQPPSQANMALAIVLILVFVIQAAFNAWQDFSSSRVMDSITGMLPENCIVLRAGNQVSIESHEVVPGDILLIKAGQKLPADVRFVEVSTDAKFDRSILTGESLPISSTIDSTDDNYLETRCIGMQGTHCISGSAHGLVVSTGDETVFGKIAKLTAAPDNKMTPLQKEILRFVIIIVSIAVTFMVIIAAVWGGYLRKKYPDYINVANFIVTIVSVGIAFVPEGLPIALTASLTIVANIMKQNNVLCKSLKTVETLGAVSVICSDKTGTLTKNVMTATDCAIGTRTMTPETALQDLEKSASNNAVRQLRSLAGLCNAGNFDFSTMDRPLEERVIQGDATDQAVLRFSESLGSVDVTRSLWRKLFEIAFNSKNKYMMRFYQLDDEVEGIKDTLAPNDAFKNDSMLLTIKGAPDVLIGRCTSFVSPDGQVVPFNDEYRRQVEAIKDGWSANGKRVILLARKVLSSSMIKADPSHGAFEDEAMEHARTGLTLVGLIGIVDPPRDEIPEVVATLRRAGIRVFMVTGDFKLTAQAIASQCGIITTPSALTHDITALSKYRSDSDISSDTLNAATAYHATGKAGQSPTDVASEKDVKAIVLSGGELNSLSDAQWTHLCSYDEIVFARTTPEQKLRIVHEFQRHDNLVAMTGDGVNDAPSLKAADIGIAMGSGSDIAIEASDMVLLDSFAGVVAAVLYGRIVFDNLKKTIVYLLPAGTFSEFWPVFTNIVFGLPQILSSFLMIMICCLTDCAAATTLAYEKPEADVMLRPPRRAKHDKLVDWRLLLHAYGFLGLPECVASFAMAYWYCERQGVPFSSLWFGYGTWGLPNDTPEHVNSVLATASSIYFVNLVIMQWFNVMATRTRRLSIFQHPPAFNKLSQNYLIFPAILFALVVVFIFCYIPSLQTVIGSSQIPVEFFFLPMAFGAGLLLLDEGRKWGVRRWPGGLLARAAW